MRGRKKHKLTLAVCLLTGLIVFLGTASFAWASPVGDALKQKEKESLKRYENTGNISSLIDDGVKEGSDPVISLNSAYPDRYDLRDKGVITPVKLQNPWGSCWSFGALSAVESSILSELGQTYKSTGLDLSERHMAWFGSTPLPSAAIMKSTDGESDYASQAGEGQYPLIADDNPLGHPMNTGGSPFLATTLMAAGIGPVAESAAPYKNEENIAIDNRDFPIGILKPGQTLKDLTDPPYYFFNQLDKDGDIVAEGALREKATGDLISGGHLLSYADGPIFDKNGVMTASESGEATRESYTWDVSEADRFMLDVELEDSAILPASAEEGEDGSYSYNPEGTEAIKSELMAGRAVQIDFCADTSMPNDQGEARFLNQNTWSHYTYDESGGDKKVDVNHDVCIVGWDDNWGVENFNQGVTEKGVNKAPPKGGAWIVKNSWGAEGQGFPNEGYGDWGIVENGKHTGYFYLSYYDMSLTRASTYEFLTGDRDDGREGMYINQYDFLPPLNVNTIDMDDETWYSNIFTASEDQLVRTLSVETAWTNSHAVLELWKLNEGAEVPVDGVKLAEVEGDFSWAGYHRLPLDRGYQMKKGERFAVVAEVTAETDKGTIYQLPFHQAASEQLAKKSGDLDTIGVGVVNEGESLLYSEEEWYDWTGTLSELDGDFVYDNFALKAFADPDDTPQLQIDKRVLNPKDVYHPGDGVTFRISVSHDGDKAMEKITVTDTLVDLGDAGHIDRIEPGETIEIDYEVVITEEDAKRGYLKNEASATTDCVGGYTPVSVSVTIDCEFPPKDHSGDTGDSRRTGLIIAVIALLVTMGAAAGVLYRRRKNR